MSTDAPQHYDRVTEAWAFLLGEDLHYGLFSDPEFDLPTATHALTEHMASLAEPAGHVLDVGCGTGRPACWLAEAFGVSVLGISTSPVGIAHARRRAERRGLQSISFEVRDAQESGLQESSFDCVWVMESSHLMPDKEAMIREGARVLGPAGRFVLCDIVLQREVPLDEVIRDADAFTLLRLVFGRAKMETPEFYRTALEANGLEVTTVEDLTERTRPTFRHWRANADDNRGEVVARIGEEEWQRFRDSCDVLERLWDTGTLGYGLLAARRKG